MALPRRCGPVQARQYSLWQAARPHLLRLVTAVHGGAFFPRTLTDSCVLVVRVRNLQGLMWTLVR